MRFPNETIPGPVAAVDTTEIGPKAAVDAVRRIGAGSRGISAQAGGGHRVDRAGEEERPIYLREDEDRRKICRRTQQIPVMLDTRSGLERRKEVRRPEDILEHMDREV